MTVENVESKGSLVECVPNFSEGRRAEIITAIVAEIAQGGVAKILDVESDADHNRSVVTFVAPQEEVVAAAFRGAAAAVRLIDLRTHQGQHPRMGAVDVIPFVPIEGVTMRDCVTLAGQLGDRLVAELELPVYFYQEAARRPERTNLEDVRRGGFEEMREKIGIDASWQPDLGPRQAHPSAGAVAVGARGPLIAFNVYLGTTDLALARSIAKQVRHRTGGLRYVKALGLEHASTGRVQVSMNLTDYRKTSIVTVMDLIRAEATRHGVAVVEAEVVGLIPLNALLDSARAFLQLHRFEASQILEKRLWQSE